LRDRAAHGAQRPHDLRRGLAVRRLVQRYRDAADLDQMILAFLSCLRYTKIRIGADLSRQPSELTALVGEKLDRFVAPAMAKDE